MLSRAGLRIPAPLRLASRPPFTTRPLGRLAQQHTIAVEVAEAPVKARTLSRTHRAVLATLVGVPMASYVLDKAAGDEGPTREWINRHCRLNELNLREGRWWCRVTQGVYHDDLLALSINTVLVLVGGKAFLLSGGIASLLFTCTAASLPPELDTKARQQGTPNSSNLGCGLALGGSA